jgi:hypothetical protein
LRRRTESDSKSVKAIEQTAALGNVTRKPAPAIGSGMIGAGASAYNVIQAGNKDDWLQDKSSDKAGNSPEVIEK